MFKVDKKVLSNGIRVVLIPMPNSQSVNVSVIVGAGSKSEDKKINGAAHFLEHLFFKGTEKRPNQEDIMRELDRIGAEHNAFTSKELTCYFVKCAAKDFAVGFDVVSDIFLNPLFKEEEIEKERGVILQEIGMFEDSPPRKIGKLINEVMYGDQPAGRSVLGTRETISAMKRSDIVEFRNKNYTARNIVIVVSGSLDKKKVFREIKDKFSVVKNGKLTKNEKTVNLQKSFNSKMVEKEMDQSVFRIGIKAYNMFDKRRYALALLSKILGESSSSRLFVEVREKLGLAYDVGCGTSLLKDSGSLFIGGGVAHESLVKTIEVIVRILKDIKKDGVTKIELEDAKSHARGQLALSFETSDQVADFYGERELFFGKIEQPEEVLKNIEKVTLNDILKVAKDILKSERMSIAVIGKNKNDTKNTVVFKEIFEKI